MKANNVGDYLLKIAIKMVNVIDLTEHGVCILTDLKLILLQVWVAMLIWHHSGKEEGIGHCEDYHKLKFQAEQCFYWLLSVIFGELLVASSTSWWFDQKKSILP